MSRKAISYIAAVLISGLSLLAYELAGFHTSHLVRFLVFFGITVRPSGLKVRLPGLNSTISVNFLFVLAAAAQLSLPEVLAAGVTGSVVQCHWRAQNRPTWLQTTFSAAGGALAFSAAYASYHWRLLDNADVGIIGWLMAASMVLFLGNTSLIATVVALTENRDVLGTSGKQVYYRCLPYYLAGGGLHGRHDLHQPPAVGWVFRGSGILPVTFIIYRAYRVYTGGRGRKPKSIMWTNWRPAPEDH